MHGNKNTLNKYSFSSSLFVTNFPPFPFSSKTKSNSNSGSFSIKYTISGGKSHLSYSSFMTSSIILKTAKRTKTLTYIIKFK